MAKAKLVAGKKTEALATAEDAVKMYVEAGDKEGEASAQNIVNELVAEKNQLAEAQASGTPELQMKEANKTIQYINFRIGGLGYGPRFRCLTAYKAAVQGKEDSLHALSCLQVSDQAEDWETELQFHPGVLDGMLQSGTAYAL